MTILGQALQPPTNEGVVNIHSHFTRLYSVIIYLLRRILCIKSQDLVSSVKETLHYHIIVIIDSHTITDICRYWTQRKIKSSRALALVDLLANNIYKLGPPL